MYKRKGRYAIDVARAYKRRKTGGPGFTSNILRSYPRARLGYASVGRARGAAVTGEMKYFDAENSSTALVACTTTWPANTLVNPLTTINLGDVAVANPNCLFAPKVSAALNGRIGRKVKVMKIKVRGHIRVQAQAVQPAADNACKIRIALVMDKQTNSAPMTSALLFNDAAAADSTINSFQNPNNFGRFRILKEKIIDISNVSMTGAAGAIEQAAFVRSFKMTVKFRIPQLVNFNAGIAGTVADIIDNSFHIVCGCNSVSYLPTLCYYVRTAYKE